MKKIAAILAFLVAFPAAVSAAQQASMTGTMQTGKAASDQPGSRVYVVKGDVFAAMGSATPHRVDQNEIIMSNMLVTTGDDSAALLKFEDGETVTMQSNSVFRVRDYRYNASKPGDSNIVFSLFKGGMRFITGLIGQRRKDAFKLLTPNSTVGIRGTEFMVAMNGTKMYSQVQSGKISLTNGGGTRLVGAGQSAMVASSNALATLVPAAAIPAGTFNGLLSIPVNPSEIPPPPAPAAAPVSAPTVSAPPAVPVPTPALVTPPAPSMPVAQAAAPAPAASPAEETEDQDHARTGAGPAVKLGTLGAGIEFNVAISDSFNARFGYNAFNHKYNADVGSVNYDANLQLGSITLLGDWYPFDGGFRTSAGLVYNDNQASLTGNPGPSGFTIDGTSYSTISSVTSTFTFNRVAPYLGIGWGNPVAKDKGWGIVTDLGILFQGSPKVDLSVVCTTAPCPSASQVAAEQSSMENDLKNYKFWPVASFGISYQW